MDIDTQMKRRRVKSEPDDDDWFGSDFSCCFCVPIQLGVKLIGMWWVINFAALVWQINGVTDDGSSKGDLAGPQFYYICYFFLSWWAYAFFKYAVWMCNDTFTNRNELVGACFVIMCSIGSLYFWLFIYFITLEEGNRELGTGNKILLVILLFCAPQLTLHSYYY